MRESSYKIADGGLRKVSAPALGLEDGVRTCWTSLLALLMRAGPISQLDGQNKNKNKNKTLEVGQC